MAVGACARVCELHLSSHYWGGGCKFHFSLFYGDIPCPSLVSVWWRCALLKLNFSLFDGDVPCPSAVVTRIIEEMCGMHLVRR